MALPLAGSPTSPDIFRPIPSSENTLPTYNLDDFSPEDYKLYKYMSQLFGTALPSEEPQDQSETDVEPFSDTNSSSAALALDPPSLSTSASVHATDNAGFVELSQYQANDAIGTTNATQFNDQVPQVWDVSGTETLSTTMLAGLKRTYDAINDGDAFMDEDEDGDDLFGDNLFNEPPAATQTPDSEGLSVAASAADQQAISNFDDAPLPQAVGPLGPPSAVAGRISQYHAYIARPVSESIASDYRFTTALQVGSGSVPLDDKSEFMKPPQLLPLAIGDGGPVPAQSDCGHLPSVSPPHDQHAHYPAHPSANTNTTPIINNVSLHQPNTHYPAHQLVHTNPTTITNIFVHHPNTHLSPPQLQNNNKHPLDLSSSIPTCADQPTSTHHVPPLHDAHYAAHLKSLGVTLQQVPPQQGGPGSTKDQGTQFMFTFRVPFTRSVTRPFPDGGQHISNLQSFASINAPTTPASAPVGALAPAPASAVTHATGSAHNPTPSRGKGKGKGKGGRTKNKENIPPDQWELIILPGIFPCLYPNCKVSFTGKGGTKGHIQAHLGKTHLWGLTQEQLVKCGFPGCETEAQTSSHGRHIQETHFKNIRYMCLRCHGEFSRKGKLVDHWHGVCGRKRANKRRRTKEVSSQ